MLQIITLTAKNFMLCNNSASSEQLSSQEYRAELFPSVICKCTSVRWGGDERAAQHPLGEKRLKDAENRGTYVSVSKWLRIRESAKCLIVVKCNTAQRGKNCRGGDAMGAGRREEVGRGGTGKRTWEEAGVKEKESWEIMDERKWRGRGKKTERGRRSVNK